ncbi:glycosyltransferase family 1 protein [Staphylococcus pragensis]|uniref:Glycosyltransferase family 1 protein n=1 Tax=Staphylococcus pragensis TaxID=1611836 RepID=A0A4Z1B6W5_9STAP|nr:MULTISPECIES: glycosyltransferase family 4 protein [Staphylococcus]RTX92024.1 glycosyltransferase family 1 protein [Staphylococcus carnosus]TGN26896.1 glycosyltransferase family 1 protein [Staphylococcus pragensis]GGG93733.1 glycosyl transferase family 1 [Staphylococcus pragensis]
MKILYLITKADNGGAQTHLIQLANYFCQNNDVYVVVGCKGPMLEQLDARIKVTIVENLIGPINVKQDILATKKITRLINKIRPDVIHLHSSKAGTIGRLAYKLSKGKKSLVVFTAHSWSFTDGIAPLKKYLYLLIEKMMFKVTNRVICVSEFDKQLAIKYNFNPRKLVTIHNGIKDPFKFTSLSHEKGDAHQFVMIARFAYPKLQMNIINALNLLKNMTDKHFHFTLIGDGINLNECKELAQSVEVTQEVSFLGNVINAQKELPHYDTFVLVSKHEGLPISIIEAMSYGLPIIASDVGGISELVDNNGKILKDNEPHTIALALKQQLENDDYIKQSDRSREKYLEHFTETKMLKEVEMVYNAYSRK